MTTHECTVKELKDVGFEVDVILRKCMDHGYTNSAVLPINHNSVFLITFDESDDKATTLTNLEAATDPLLSVSSSVVEIAGDGVATGSVTLSDSRGAGADGKTVLLEVASPGALPLSGGGSYVLDASGDATVNFGVSPATDWCSGLITLRFTYATGEAAMCELTVRYTG